MIQPYAERSGGHGGQSASGRDCMTVHSLHRAIEQWVPREVHNEAAECNDWVSLRSEEAQTGLETHVRNPSHACQSRLGTE